MAMSAEHSLKFEAFHRYNGVVSIWVKNFQVGRKTTDKQTNNI